jgi:hypothetical protein
LVEHLATSIWLGRENIVICWQSIWQPLLLAEQTLLLTEYLENITIGRAFGNHYYWQSKHCYWQSIWQTLLLAEHFKQSFC